MLLGNAHGLKCRDYPLMLGDNLLSLGLFLHPLYVSLHYSLDLLPLKAYLVGGFYHLRAAEIHSLLDFVPLSLPKVEDRNEQL